MKTEQGKFTFGMPEVLGPCRCLSLSIVALIVKYIGEKLISIGCIQLTLIGTVNLSYFSNQN